MAIRKSHRAAAGLAVLLAALLAMAIAATAPVSAAFADDSTASRADAPQLADASSTSRTDAPQFAAGGDAAFAMQARGGLAPYTVTAIQRQDIARAMLPLVNNLRASEGSSALAWDVDLEQAAIQRAAECAVLFSHTRPSGHDWFTVSDKAWGENIAMIGGVSDSASLFFDMWNKSEGHHANMVNKDFKSIGVGGVCVNDNGGKSYYYYVQLFSFGDGTGMTRAPATSEQDFTVHVPTMAVKSMSVSSPVNLGVGATEPIPNVQLTYQSLTADGDDLHMQVQGTQTQSSRYFQWDVDNADIASFIANGMLVVGNKKGSVTARASLSDNSKSAQFTINVTSWARLWGDDAYGTMCSIVQSAFGAGQCDTVILATFDGYWDALTASGLAGVYQCPILMTGTDSLNAMTKSEIERLGAARVVIAGGPKAVSASVENQVKQIPGVRTVVRAQGVDAADTACKIYDLAVSEGHAWSDTAFIATADGYWDALAASPLAYSLNRPVFLASTGAGAKRLDDATLNQLRAAGFKNIVICGGTAAVSRDVERQLASIGLSGSAVVRKAGDTAVETSVELAKHGVSKGMSNQGVAVATLGGYWDSLSGAAFCGRYGVPLVLISDGCRNAIPTFIQPNASTMTQGFVFGGTAAVSADTYAKLAAVF